ncbi:MAG TPA: histidine triad nucleotide-binding protein [Pyrinomonadaceae bacterium]|nr:histidine triad nucleotide-binding protein [Pyrinomonadaceae bacterium]
MAESQDCIFCKIAAGEIPSGKVFEDERAVAFRDINAQAPTHVLVIPREHVASLEEAGDAQESMLGHLLLVAARVAREQGLKDSGYRTVINTGAGAGQSVFHLHLHVLGGRPLSWPPG